MEHMALFKTLDADRLMEINGGGFAYDAGRVLRFLFFVQTYGYPYADADWYANQLLNEEANN